MFDRDKIVLTGGGGFIGVHLANYFRQNFHVVLFDNFRRNSIQYFPEVAADSNVEIIEGDIRDAGLIAKVVDGAAAIIHLAAIAGVSNYMERPHEVLRVNILGTTNVIDVAIEAGCKRLIHFSTSEVYGDQKVEMDEENSHLIFGPVSEKRWVYAVSKLAGEHLMISEGDAQGMAVTCMRPFNVYGPGQVGEGAISNFCRALVAEQPLKIYHGGKDIRSWCFVDDLVDAVASVLYNPTAFGKSFNIGNPSTSCDTLELANKLIKINGNGRMEHFESGHVPIHNRIPKVDLATKTFGFTPKINLEEGLIRTLAWFKNIENGDL